MSQLVVCCQRFQREKFRFVVGN